MSDFSGTPRLRTAAKTDHVSKLGARTDLGVAAALVLVVTVAVMVLSAIFTIRDDRRVIEVQLQTSATNLARSIDLKLRTYKAALATIAQSTALRVDFDIDALAVDAQRVGELFGGWFIVTAGGDRMEILMATRSQNGTLPPSEPRENYPEVVRAEDESLRVGDSVVSDAFPGRVAGELVVAVASPVDTAQTPQPFIYFSVSLRDIAQWLAETPLAEAEFATISDGSRRVIARSQDDGSPLLAELPQWYRAFADTRTQGVIRGAAVAGSEPRLFALQRLEVAPRWTLAVSRPVPSLMPSVLRAAWPALLALLVSGTIAVLALGRRRARADMARAAQEATEKAGLFDELRTADARKARLMAVLAHDLRTPLVALIGSVDRLCDDPSAPSRLQECARMKSSGNGMLQLIDDVLELARLGSGELRLRPEPFVPAALLSDVGDLVRAQAAGNGTVVVIDAGTVSPVSGDTSAIRRILTNFATNAVKATRGGTIHFRAQADAAENATHVVTFSVTDTGCGIAQDDLPKLFRDFAMLERAGGGSAGTGLGLAICSRLAEAMGGSVGVESTLGQGSRFWLRLTLPAAAVSPAAVAEDIADRSKVFAGLRVLVVEDHETIRRLTVMRLAHLGAVPIAAVDGDEAVALAAAQTFDLILMDMNMPLMNGAAAAAHIRHGGGPCARTRIIGVTASQNTVGNSLRCDPAMDTCLAKPLDFKRLAAYLSGQAPVTMPAPPGPDFDPDTLAHLASFDQGALLARTLDGFVRETGVVCSELAEFLAAGDTVGAFRLAHKLAGLCDLVGARSLSAELHRFAKLTQTADLAELGRALQKLQTTMQLAQQMAQMLVRNPPLPEPASDP